MCYGESTLLSFYVFLWRLSMYLQYLAIIMLDYRWSKSKKNKWIKNSSKIASSQLGPRFIAQSILHQHMARVHCLANARNVCCIDFRRCHQHHHQRQHLRRHRSEIRGGGSGGGFLSNRSQSRPPPFDSRVNGNLVGFAPAHPGRMLPHTNTRTCTILYTTHRQLELLRRRTRCGGVSLCCAGWHTQNDRCCSVVWSIFVSHRSGRTFAFRTTLNCAGSACRHAVECCSPGI